MKISGFTLIRNGDRFDYPYLESLRSMLPLVDELIINVGNSETEASQTADQTLKRVRQFANEEGGGKVHYFVTDWQLDNPEKKKGGLILSEQTNLALDRCSHDWCLYLQADEVLHERDLERIRGTLETYADRPDVEGLLFDYLHFYGSFDVIQQSRSAYRREVRMIRKSSHARSVGDAQSFKKQDGSKLQVVHSEARIFHYGWVRTPGAMREKTYFMDQLYHGAPSPENALQGIPHTGENYRYKRFWGLRAYQGEHPSVMSHRIQTKGWHWDLKGSCLVFSLGDVAKVFLDMFEQLSGHRLFEYKSYRLI